MKKYQRMWDTLKQNVTENHFVKKLLQRYPRLFAFLRRRITPGTRFGLLLTLGTLISFIFVWLFLGVLEDYYMQEPLIQADLRLINLLQIFRTHTTTRWMLFITHLGGWQTVVFGLALLCIYFLITRHWEYLAALLLSVGGSEIFVWAVKTLTARPRPPLVNAIAPEKSYSFPSGHTFIAFSFYGLLAYFAFRGLKKTHWKILSVAACVMLIVVLGFSRIYLGAHWPSDVIASLASGTAWLVALITALEIRRKYGKGANARTPLTKNNAIFVGLVFFALWTGFIAYFNKTHVLLPVPAARETRKVIATQDLNKHLFDSFPRLSETITGAPMEPINIILIGDFNKIKGAFAKAAWLQTENITLQTTWRLLTTSLFNQAYPQAPGTPSFWNTRPNEFAFEKPTSLNSVRERNHIHIWHTSLVTEKGEQIWFGTAHLDQGVKRVFGIFPVHTINPNIDEEREAAERDLVKSGGVVHVSSFRLVPPTQGKNQAGDTFYTDGHAYIITLQ
jgi:undecaprenyl-diphosphatase